MTKAQIRQEIIRNLMKEDKRKMFLRVRSDEELTRKMAFISERCSDEKQSELKS